MKFQLWKAIGLLVIGGFTFGGGYSLINEAVVKKNSLAIGILIGVAVLVLVLVGVCVSILLQYVQSKIAISHMMANSAENNQLLTAMQKQQAGVLALQSKAVGNMSRNAALIDGGSVQSLNTQNDTEDLLIFDNNAFNEVDFGGE